ncbi:MAG: imidazole glycerol phosphate synthase subunit HisH [Candidatus Omnitrophica bacterium]|nr:imidazole glycerol phosphate synthase subunit HisH [Candidatus Omnitrophota bacterium]MBU1997568.1 imidazole glycerol phosphate synthase subunit HisH [Candidatus Omnitrophota bacterium]MBU4333278.1 imidazole glycerol phosphate synthase subunit HisH [Candidatus Omnitrophota bacterium]
MIAIIDYGMGNLRSVQKAFEKVGAKASISQNKDEILNADKVVLPGVGAIKPAIEKLKELGLVSCIEKSIEQGKPFLGICLGYQLLFERSDEGGEVRGLGIIEGSVERFKPTDDTLKVPQMGWNQLDIRLTNCPIFKDIDNKVNTYFCHSYYVNPRHKDIVATTTNYGIDFASSIWKDNIYGVQFHPEKSQDAGLTILKNFTEI